MNSRQFIEALANCRAEWREQLGEGVRSVAEWRGHLGT